MPSKDDIIAELRELVEKQAKPIAALTQEVADHRFHRPAVGFPCCAFAG